MSYATGAASSSENLLQLLATFLGNNGYTINRQDNDGTHERLNISKNGYYFNFYARQTSINITQSTGYANVARGAQANETDHDGNSSTESNGIYIGNLTAHHFFYDNNFCHVVIESTAGHFDHFVFGEITKYGTWTGGAYIDAQWWDGDPNYTDVPHSSTHKRIADSYNYALGRTGYLRYDRDSTPQFTSHGQNPGTTDFVMVGTTVVSGRDDYSIDEIFSLVTPTDQTSRVIPTPIQLYVTKGTTGLYEPVGMLPFTRCVNIKLINPGDLIDSDWMVFPYRSRKDPSLRDNNANSGYDGFAIKRVL